MNQLAGLIDVQAATLLKQWVTLVAASLAPGVRTTAELADHMPEFLQHVIAVLREPAQHPDAALVNSEGGVGEARGAQRFRMGFKLEAVVREHSLLLDLVLDLVEATGTSVTMLEVRRLNDLITQDVAEAAAEYVRRLVETEKASTVREREYLASAFAQAPVAACILHGERYVVTLANPAVCRIWGRTDAQVIHQPLFDAMPETRGQGLEALLAEVRRTGEPYVGRELPVTLARLDGGLETVFFNFVYQPLRAADGSVTDILVVATDVTVEVRARRGAEAMSAEFERRHDFEQHLVGIVSHDLRDPVSVIILSAAALLRMEPQSERTTKLAQRIRTSADRAARMIHDLLDFTQARLGGGIRLESRPADLHAVASAALVEAGAAYPDRTLALSRAGDTHGTWDADRIAQVVANLVTNALKYSPVGSPVAVCAAGQDRAVELTVHNEGPPIAPERLGQIFEPLQRATDKIDAKTRSVGLGLYIVHAIVLAHGGTVAVVSTVEAGTTFTVRLPREASGGGSHGRPL